MNEGRKQRSSVSGIGKYMPYISQEECLLQFSCARAAYECFAELD